MKSISATSDIKGKQCTSPSRAETIYKVQQTSQTYKYIVLLQNTRVTYTYTGSLSLAPTHKSLLSSNTCCCCCAPSSHSIVHLISRHTPHSLQLFSVCIIAPGFRPKILYTDATQLR